MSRLMRGVTVRGVSVILSSASRLSTTLPVLALTFALACDNLTTAPDHGHPAGESPQLSQRASTPLSGWYHTQWGDPPAGQGVPRRVHHLIDDGGHATELVLDEASAAQHGGLGILNGKRVRVDGEQLVGGKLRVQSLDVDRSASAMGAPEAAAIGSHPYITIGCKFSDRLEPRPMSTYQAWTAGTSYPGLNHYWPEQSFGQMNVTGSTVVGWYTLSQPESYYIDLAGNPDFGKLVADCTGAADPDVDFPQYFGINLQFNGSLGCCSWGGSWMVIADGQTKRYGMTWMAAWSSVSVYAHEEGHSLGLMHSSGPYFGTYDSGWDVMSNAYVYFDGAQGAYIPEHTISYHKDLLGWIPAARKLTVANNTSQTVTLERLAQPGSGNYLMAQIPIDNAPGQFYTVEARRVVGRYDSHLPGEAIVLHRVNPGLYDRLAQVVDVDSNGDPNDAGAMWTAGETFTDQANGISVAVNARTATGFQVTITRGTPPANTWASGRSLLAARSDFVLAKAGALLYAIGGTSNGTKLASVEEYNATSNTWTRKAALPSSRFEGNGAWTIGGVLYLPGGRNASGALTKTLYAYRVSTNTWSTKAALPTPSGCGGTVEINGQLYVFTGCNAATGFKGLLHRYTPLANVWTARASAPAAHGNPALGVINGKLYVAGGQNAAGTATATLHEYNPVTNTWSTKAAMPSARFKAAGLVIKGKLYVVGGTAGNGVDLTATLVYDPVTNVWSTKAVMPTARRGLASGLISGLLYAVGGRGGTSDLKVVERYSP
jgi:M6 family metalloprotease-like protein